MCLTCGCMKPNDPHGNDANITLPGLKAAADAQKITVAKAARNLVDTLRQAGHIKMAGSASRFVSVGDDEFLSDFEIIDVEEADDNATMQAEERAEEAVSGKPPSRSAALNALRDVLSKRKPSGS